MSRHEWQLPLYSARSLRRFQFSRSHSRTPGCPNFSCRPNRENLAYVHAWTKPSFGIDTQQSKNRKTLLVLPIAIVQSQSLSLAVLHRHHSELGSLVSDGQVSSLRL